VDQGQKDSIYRGYRVITVTGVVLFMTLAALLTFAVLWVNTQQGWADFPLNAEWADGLVLLFAAAVPAGARLGSEYFVARTSRRGTGTKLVVALQVVSWATLGIWVSCQVPLIFGLAMAFLRHRSLFLLPFFGVGGAAVMLVAPKFTVWEHWFALLEHPEKRTKLHTL
jgi:hypothetical protein